MTTKIPQFLIPALENIYISPLELCNLNCKLCYTNKTKSVLTNNQILDFVSSYSDYLQSNSYDLKSILFCGGEVFTLPNFCDLINQLTAQNIFISIITNGTIDHLDQIHNPNSVQLLVSLDGPRDIHDANRGKGNFDKSIKFINHALQLGFHTEIMFLVSPTSYPFIDTFGDYVFSLVRAYCNTPLSINFITIKSSAYTTNHSLSVRNRHAYSLQPHQIINIKKNYPSLPAKDFGCFQLSLQSNGNFYGCCESPTPIGNLADSFDTIITNYIQSFSPCFRCKLSSLKNNNSVPVRLWRKHGKKILRNDLCLGCCNSNFLCGYKKELQLTSCVDVVNNFNT